MLLQSLVRACPSAAKSNLVTAIYDLVIDGWSNDLAARGLRLVPNDIERELRFVRESGFKIVRPPNTLHTFCRAIGIAAVVSRYEFHTLKEMGFETEASRRGIAWQDAERTVVLSIAKSLGRNDMWVRAVILLYREYVIKPAREEIDGNEKKTVAELVRVA